MAEIQLERVTKRFADGTKAVDDVELTIGDGEFFILVGPSGCGKSTLLNMIVGLEDISEGEIRVDGQVVNDVDPKDRGMAMVFQSYAIYPHMTVYENMAFPLRLAKTDGAEVDKRVRAAAAMLELGELLDRKPANLSGGQRQRVAMGRAIVREPKAFLMDEPLSNLDAKLRVQMRGQLAGLQDRLGITTVYVTHDQTEAMTLGDRAAVMRKGQVQQIDPPRELYRNPANVFVAGFIGSPAMNFLPGTLIGNHLRLPFAEVDLPSDVTDRYRSTADEVTRTDDGEREGIVGIRPENFEDARHVEQGIEDLGVRFTARVEQVEWLGAEVFAYFRIGGSSTDSVARLMEDLDTIELAQGDEQRVAAQIDRRSDIRTGREADLWLDPRELHLFDPETGENLTRYSPEAPTIDLRSAAEGPAPTEPGSSRAPVIEKAAAPSSTPAGE
jgi:multiple sugar transport system ATP-binding protein